MPSHPSLTPGNTALITGGASGIGLAVASLLHSRGLQIALVDIDTSALSSAQQSLLSSPTTDGASLTNTASASSMIKTYTCDVSILDRWKDLKAKVEMDFGFIHVVMLNAAIQLPSGWEDVTAFEKTLQTNTLAPLYGLTTFLPSLRRLSPTQTSIILTGSKQGITNPPGNPAYNASKAALTSIAESLSFDLRNTSTSVHLLVPGWTWTGLSQAAMSKTAGGDKEGEKPTGAWTPEQVAHYLEEKMGEDKFYIICPDNDVSEEMDRKRILWGTGDVVENRPPLSRWREGWKEDAEKWMREKG